jgi:hypothetical protein
MVIGGPKREAFNNGNVIPTNFSKEDPFWDLSAQINEIEKDVRDGKVGTLLFITRGKCGIKHFWRGDETLTVALGVLEYVKQDMWASNCLCNREE